MVIGTEKYKDSIIQSLKYIIDRNCDYDVNSISTIDAETADCDFCKRNDRYIVFANNKKYFIDWTMTISDANDLLLNIDSIEYLYSEFDKCDTLVGDIRKFISSSIFSDFNDILLAYAKVRYDNYIRTCVSIPAKDDAVCFVKESFSK